MHLALHVLVASCCVAGLFSVPSDGKAPLPRLPSRRPARDLHVKSAYVNRTAAGCVLLNNAPQPFGNSTPGRQNGVSRLSRHQNSSSINLLCKSGRKLRVARRSEPCIDIGHHHFVLVSLQCHDSLSWWRQCTVCHPQNKPHGRRRRSKPTLGALVFGAHILHLGRLCE